ncbi:hypothetical protein ASG52_20710 [Methylobacterium sp. Leaf456]|uniref:hypothetical protein n=1 Tax=Methylobacterium sp. Leaf456 TaxID=1736382 RepID=UPI0006F7F7DB|nr:hypothetical protein [Methylobacterium sp. Leaf456]KQT58564.1 hypothetical protein ASG52_20710 [Methylobacterium sp. Leaf456]
MVEAAIAQPLEAAVIGVDKMIYDPAAGFLDEGEAAVSLPTVPRRRILQELEGQLFRTSRRTLGTHTAEARQGAPQDPRGAEPSGLIEIDHCVGGGQARADGAEIVAVHHPGREGCDALDFRAERVRSRFDPTGTPIGMVEVEHREPVPSAETAGQRRLPAARRPQHDDAPGRRIGLAAHALGRLDHRRPLRTRQAPGSTSVKRGSAPRAPPKG